MNLSFLIVTQGEEKCRLECAAISSGEGKMGEARLFMVEKRYQLKVIWLRYLTLRVFPLQIISHCVWVLYNMSENISLIILIFLSGYLHMNLQCLSILWMGEHIHTLEAPVKVFICKAGWHFLSLTASQNKLHFMLAPSFSFAQLCKLAEIQAVKNMERNTTQKRWKKHLCLNQVTIPCCLSGRHKSLKDTSCCAYDSRRKPLYRWMSFYDLCREDTVE